MSTVITQAPSSSPSDIVNTIQQFANQFASGASAVLSSVDNATLDIARSAIVALILVGVVLYFTRLNKRLGRDLLTGGIFLGIFTVYGIPYLMSLHM